MARLWELANTPSMISPLNDWTAELRNYSQQYYTPYSYSCWGWFLLATAHWPILSTMDWNKAGSLPSNHELPLRWDRMGNKETRVWYQGFPFPRNDQKINHPILNYIHYHWGPWFRSLTTARHPHTPLYRLAVVVLVAGTSKTISK